MAKIHILGICGTFMGGIAAIAKQLGHQVSGSDQNVYPPMSTQLTQLGINIHTGYGTEVFHTNPDVTVVGNVMTRGMPATEHVLSEGINYVSGPQWLGDTLLRQKCVYAVAGTHGKTTTSSMLAWILEDQGLDPGFLIGGVCHHFQQSARTTASPSFVIEADEYDSAFFDKRSKFLHYHSNVVILNNLEFDHADIFNDINDIKKQFHHLIRTIPKDGLLVVNHDDEHLQSVIEQGCWTPMVTFGLNSEADYWIQPSENGLSFGVMKNKDLLCHVDWDIMGQHNQLNGLAAILAAQHAGVDPSAAAASLSRFKSVKRRMELIGEVNDISIYDDFAHHPTAIATTIEGAKKAHPGRRIVVVLEPRSNSMRAGAHANMLPQALAKADFCLMMHYPEMSWDGNVIKQLHQLGVVTAESTDDALKQLSHLSKPGDVIVFMSNGGFDQIHISFYNQMLK